LIDDEAADVATERLASSLQSTSGNPKLDRYLGKALVRLADTFGVDPGFGFIDDAQLPRPNAFAMSKTLVPSTEGTVMFGLQLFNKTMSKRHDQGLSVLAICAHEFGHIVQFETQYYTELSRGQPTVKHIELHADFLAGFYLATIKRRTPTLQLQDVGKTFDHLGDTEFSNPLHHGTNDERVHAIEGGSFFGREHRATVAQAAANGAEFIIQHFS
jgi:hypothetical protein